MRECFCLFLFMLHFTEGCQLSGYRESKVTGYTGGSVLLPCSCTDLQSTVKFTWYHTTDWFKVFEDVNFKGRWKLFNESSPANLSLLISDLRKSDEGSYRCETSGRNYTDIRVNIKGCDLDQNKQTVEMTGHSGESVVLPCSCTELQDKPPQLTWTYTSLKHKRKPEEIYPNEQSERHRGRRDVKKMNNDGLVLVCSENENQADVIPDNLTQGQNLKQDQNEDEVTYTSVVHVKTAAKPADKQTVMEEHSEYASIK
ncbi:hypothetical protein ABG768_019674 [Culter alburnus]|uniref:Ig-like domain-containing protein n=1 Tax=Culter alburnus TaxID=194366 RepID=A0AAW2AY75_CULAL